MWTFHHTDFCKGRWGSTCRPDWLWTVCPHKVGHHRPMYLFGAFLPCVGWGEGLQCHLPLCGGQRTTCKCQFFPFALWGLGLELSQTWQHANLLSCQPQMLIAFYSQIEQIFLDPNYQYSFFKCHQLESSRWGFKRCYNGYNCISSA